MAGTTNFTDTDPYVIDYSYVNSVQLSRAIKRLKERIKHEAQQVREMRRKARTLQGMERHDLQMRARNIGSTRNRASLLAYAFLRRKRYLDVEQFSRQEPRGYDKVLRWALDIPEGIAIPSSHAPYRLSRWMDASRRWVEWWDPNNIGYVGNQKAKKAA